MHTVCWSRSARMSRTLAYFFKCLPLLIGCRCYSRAAVPPLTKSIQCIQYISPSKRKFKYIKLCKMFVGAACKMHDIFNIA